jgi:hypothetical protein
MNTLFPLGWSHYLTGGLSIGLAVSLMFVLTGRVTGMSSAFTTTWSYVSNAPFFRQPKHLGSRVWRLVLAIGLVLGAALWWLAFGSGTPLSTEVPWWQLLIGGFLVGYGARLSEGCTSGHGICGLASLNPASLAAVVTFLATAIVTANIVAALGGR